jgi:CheY-like chemotaxis protein
MEKIRVIIQRHKQSHLPNVLFLSATDKEDELYAGVRADFDDVLDVPVDELLWPSCELISDTVIEAENWPAEFPTGYRLMHDPRLIAYSQREDEIDELEQQWDLDDE